MYPTETWACVSVGYTICACIFNNYSCISLSIACPGVNGATGECNGHGNCSSGIDGDGLCTCEVSTKLLTRKPYTS